MTKDSSPRSTPHAVPVAARFAILVLMAGVLVYGWQSAGARSVNGLAAPVSDSGAGANTPPAPESVRSAQVREMGSATTATPSGANGSGPLFSLASLPDRRGTTPSDGSRWFAVEILYWILDCTVFWAILPVFLLLTLLWCQPARLQRFMSRLNESGALLLVGLSVAMLICASIGFQGIRQSVPDNLQGAGTSETNSSARGQEASRGEQNVVHDLYQILQLLNFNTDTARLTGVLLWAAILACLIAILAAREILQALFYDLLVRLQMVLVRDHIVVIGLGRLGRQVIETILTDKIGRSRLIVVVERDPQNPNLKWARQKGLLVIQGDGAETEDLQRAQLLRAHEAFVCIGADETNISCLATIRELYEEAAKAACAGRRWPAIPRFRFRLQQSRVTFRPRCFVHIMNHDLLRAVRLFEQKHEQDVSNRSPASEQKPTAVSTSQHDTSAATHFADGMLTHQPDLEIFSTPERTIWKLMTQLGRLKSETLARARGPESQRTERGCFTDEDTWHYILLGFGEFGRTLALSLAEHSHCENGLRVRMTICDRGIQQKQSDFLSRYSQFCQPIKEHSADAHLPYRWWWTDSLPDRWGWAEKAACSDGVDQQSSSALQPIEWVCRADFLEYHEATDDGFLKVLMKRVCRPGVRAAVFVCFEDEQENFTTSLRLHQKLQDQIQQTAFPKPGKSSPVDKEAMAARLCWPVFAWLPRQSKLATLIKDIEFRAAEKQRADKEKAKQEKTRKEATPQSKSDSQTAAQIDSPHLRYRPLLIPFGQNYENINYPEITRSWIDAVARLINLVWEQPGECQEHGKLLSLVRLHHGGELTANPWELVFDASWPSDDSAPETRRTDEWLESFAAIHWDKLEQTAEERWRKKEEWERYSNRSAAIHSVLKAAYLGLQIKGGENFRSPPVLKRELLYRLTYGVLRKLSEMEHNRWIAERLLDGWWFHPARGERSRWQLTPFSSLASMNNKPKSGDVRDQREKDARIIMLVLGLMATGRLSTTGLLDEPSTKSSD